MAAQQRYRAVIVGLTGIGATRPEEPKTGALFGPMPNSHASAYHLHPRTDVVAVCDIRAEALTDFRDRWADVWPEVRLYEDYGEMLRKETPDLVSVATSDHVHADITVAAVEAGARAILCEKPIATSLEDADRMIAATREAGVLLSIEHTRRWFPSYSQVKDMLVAGEIGAVRTIVCEMFSRRAMLFRNGTHYVDVMNWFAEGSPEWVIGDLEPGFGDWTEYQGEGGRDPDEDPYASAYIRYNNGVRGFLNIRKVDFGGGKFAVTCDGGRVEISDRDAQVIRGSSFRNWETTTLVPGSFAMERQTAAVAELINVLESGGELVSPGTEARKTLEVILAILKSNHDGNVKVRLPIG